MTQPGDTLCWWHWIISTHGSWLHGDERGFRSRNHRLHSSGDYKQPPPENEHEGLRRFHRAHSAKAVVIPESIRENVGRAILQKMQSQQLEVIVVAVSGTHVHGVTRMTSDRRAAKRLIGTWKQASSHAIRQTLLGQVWAEGSDPVPIKDHGHQVNAFNYILRHAEHGAWVWTFRGESEAPDVLDEPDNSA